MLNEMAMVWLLVISVMPPPANAQASVGRACQSFQSKRMQLAPVSSQHNALLTPQKRKAAAQKQGQDSPPGVTWYRLPEPTLRSQQAGPQGGGFGPEQPLDRDYGQDNIDDKFDSGGHDYNNAKLMSAGKRVRT